VARFCARAKPDFAALGGAVMNNDYYVVKKCSRACRPRFGIPFPLMSAFSRLRSGVVALANARYRRILADHGQQRRAIVGQSPSASVMSGA
jgi:hypothetical protein